MPDTDLKKHFLLKSGITYLNFGSFGACVKPVFDEYQRFQRELEEEPVQFFIKNGPLYLEKSRKSLAGFLNCGADDLVYVTNPSYAVNIVAKSLQLKQGDEILSTDLEYGACERTWNFCCERSGATFRKQKLSLPFNSVEKIVEELFAGANKKTRMVFLSHITSSTALVLPVGDICRKAREMGIPCFVDGAHAPGQVPVDLTDLGADYYTGACHKWMLAPKGSAFLHVRREHQDQLDPLTVSWGYQSENPSPSRFIDYHENQGTRDYSAFLAVPAAINFMKEHDWTAVSKACRRMVHKNADRFSSLLGLPLLAAPVEDFTAQMLSVPVRTEQPEKLQQKLFEDHSIEIPVMRHNNDVYLRYSVNAFNEQRDLDLLYDALRKIILSTNLLLV